MYGLDPAFAGLMKVQATFSRTGEQKGKGLTHWPSPSNALWAILPSRWAHSGFWASGGKLKKTTSQRCICREELACQGIIKQCDLACWFPFTNSSWVSAPGWSKVTHCSACKSVSFQKPHGGQRFNPSGPHIVPALCSLFNQIRRVEHAECTSHFLEGLHKEGIMWGRSGLDHCLLIHFLLTFSAWQWTGVTPPAVS